MFPGQYCLDCIRFLDCYYKANFIVIFNVLDLNIFKVILKDLFKNVKCMKSCFHSYFQNQLILV